MADIPTNLSRFQIDCLVAIRRVGDIHGLGVRDYLEGHGYGDGEVNHGRLYDNLGALVEEGLVEKDARDKRTDEYNLSPRGERVLQAYIEWVKGAIEG